MTPKREGTLSRWARRKAEAREAEAVTKTASRGAALPAAPTPSAPSDPAQPPAVEPTAAAETIPEHLPDIESLDYESDYSEFMSGDVSEAVKNMALRKLWRSNPLLANVDGLVDYDDDFSDAATVVEGLKSVYRVGRGMLQDEPDADGTTAGEEAKPEREDAVASQESGEEHAVTPEQDGEQISDVDPAPQGSKDEEPDEVKNV